MRRVAKILGMDRNKTTDMILSPEVTVSVSTLRVALPNR